MDRDKVIRALKYCTTHYCCRNLISGETCPYINECKLIENAIGNTMMRDAAELLDHYRIYAYSDCPICGGIRTLSIDGACSFSEIGMEGDGIITTMHCIKCDSEIEYRVPIKHEEAE